ncbi:MAG TPA: hypothetical protein VIK53_14730 [Verrucomicrobiae bacterium]
MKTQVLLLGAVVAAFAVTSFAAEPLLSPRAQASQIKTVKGVNNDVNPALVCQKTMTGSPKAVAECSSHTTMPGCMKMASLK